MYSLSKFKRLCHSILVECNKELNSYNISTKGREKVFESRGYSSPMYSSYNEEEPNYAYIVINVGGYSGGSCWESSNPQPYTNDIDMKDRHFVFFDKVLEFFYEDISFLEYRALYSDLVKSETFTQSEYYGNSEDYECEYVDLNALYEYLKEKGKLEV